MAQVALGEVVFPAPLLQPCELAARVAELGRLADWRDRFFTGCTVKCGADAAVAGRKRLLISGEAARADEEAAARC